MKYSTVFKMDQKNVTPQAQSSMTQLMPKLSSTALLSPFALKEAIGRDLDCLEVKGITEELQHSE